MNISDVLALTNRTRAADTSTTGGTSSSGSAPTAAPSNQLNANSFITLLTAQLQAQDPLSPMDPGQMMSELVSMNSLQELIAIRQDLEGGAVAPTGGSSNASSIGSTSVSPGQTAGPSPSYHDAVFQQKLSPA